MKPTIPPAAQLSIWTRPALFLIALGALGLFLGQPNLFLHFPPAIVIPGICLFLLAFTAERLKALFWQGWLLGTLGYCGAIYWIAVPVNEIGGLPMPLAIPCVFFLSAYLGLFVGITALCFKWLQQVFGLSPLTGGAPQAGFFKVVACAVFSGLCVGGVELFLMNKLFTGFPWPTMAAGLVAWPAWAQGAHLVGAYGLAAFFSFAAILGLCAFLVSGRVRFLAAILSLGLFAAAPLYGTWRLNTVPQPSSPALTFGIVQGNIDQAQKWSPEFQRHTIATYFALSDALVEKARTQGHALSMLIWPETAMPFPYEVEDLYASALRHFAAKHGTPIGFGTVAHARGTPGNKIFNRFQTISALGRTTGHYDKQHLVPFGEFAPFTIPIEFIENMLQGMAFVPGKTTSPLPLASPESGILFGVLICYEAIYPEIAQKQVGQGANLFINISNDAWFGPTSAPEQHLALTALRAIEQQRPIVRSTNSGHSASIDAYGRIAFATSLYTEDASLASLHPEEDNTPFHTAFAAIQLLLALGLAFSVLCGVYLWRVPKRS